MLMNFLNPVVSTRRSGNEDCELRSISAVFISFCRGFDASYLLSDVELLPLSWLQDANVKGMTHCLDCSLVREAWIDLYNSACLVCKEKINDAMCQSLRINGSDLSLTLMITGLCCVCVFALANGCNFMSFSMNKTA